MGLGRFFRSFVDKEVLGEEIVAAVEKMCRTEAWLSPGATPHAVLADVWKTRMKLNRLMPGMGRREFNDLAWLETQNFACLPHPQNAKALGLYFILKERRDVVFEHEHFLNEYVELLGTLQPARDDGLLQRVYTTLNPGSGWSWVTDAERYGTEPAEMSS